MAEDPDVQPLVTTKADLTTSVTALQTKAKKGIGLAPAPSSSTPDAAANTPQAKYDSIVADIDALAVQIAGLP